MSVHCDNCKAAYDIDESRIPESGLAVKCSKCNTLFVVKPQKIQPEIVEPVTLAPVAEENVDWDALEKTQKKFKGYVMRRPDGRTYPFQEVATLQRWVIERKALKTDEMSNDGGETWVKLSEVKELGSFFSVVNAASTVASMQAQPAPAAASQPAERPRMTMQMWAQPTEAPATESAQAAAPVEKQVASGVVQESIASTFSSDSAVVEAQAEKPVEEKPVMPRAIPEQAKVEVEVKKTTKEDFEDTRITPAPLKPSAEPQFPPRDEKPQPVEAEAAVEEKPVEEAKKRALSGIVNAKRSNTSDFDMAKWEAMADDDSEVSGKKGKIILAAVFILIIAAVAVVMFVPQVKGLIFKGSVPAEEISKLDAARATMNLFSDGKLNEAATMVKPITESQPEYAPAWALLTEIASTRADLWTYKLEEAEKFQKDADNKIQDLKAAYEEAKAQAEKDKLRAEMEKATVDLNAANLAVAEAAKQVNEQIGQLDASASKCFELAPESLETNRALADYYRCGGNTAKSNEFLEKALKLDPNDAPSLYVKGALLSADAGLLADALEALKASIAADATLLKARFRLAHVLIKNNNPDEARKTLDELLKQNPDHQPSLDLLASLKKPEEAAPAQNTEAAGSPEGETQPEAKPAPKGPATYEEFMRAGDALRNADNPNGALASYKKAWGLKQTVNAATGLGFCYYDLFNYKEALNFFKKASGMASGDQATLIGLAMTYDKLNDAAKAVEYYKIYLRNFPRGEDAVFAKNAIERLQPQQ